MDEKRTKICKYCKSEIPKDAKICPNCRKKQGSKILPIVIIVIALIILASAFSGGNKSSEKNNSVTVQTDAGVPKEKETVSETTEEQTTEAAIEYTAYSVDEMMDDLNANALKAQDKYNNQYVEITGKLSVIDSSGKYISLMPLKEDFALIGVTCNIKDDEAKSKVMDMSTDDTVTLKGKVKDVGEIMGYTLDIIEIN